MNGSCQDLVRTFDKDYFLATLFAPDEKRSDLFALQAFYIELSRIGGLVSDPQIGEVRLQWWRDTLDSVSAGAVQQHPIAIELARICARHQLPIGVLLTAIDAHQFDLYADRMPNIHTLEGYVGETTSSMFQLLAMIVSPEEARSVTELAGFAGVAFGVSRLLAKRGPSSNLVPDGMTIADLQTHARKRLAEARACVLPKSLMPVFLPVALTELYLDTNRHVGHLRRQWRLWRAAKNEKI